MPSKSKAQRNLMAAAAHNPAFAKKVGVPESVAKEFNQADKGKKFKGGGMALFKGKETYGEELKEAKALKSGKISSKQFVKGEKSEGHKDEENPSLLAKEIKSGSMSPKQYASVEAKEKKMKKGGMCKKYARGGGIEVRGKTKGKFV
jgi:hypothetical protein